MAQESESDVESKSDSRLFYLFKVNSERSKSDAIWLRPRINDVKLKMELDTGSALSIISNRDFWRHFNSLKLKETPIELKTYTGEVVKPFWVLNVTIKHKDQSAAKPPLYVVQNGNPPLFGRDWLSDIQLDWQHIKSLRQTKRTLNLDSLLNKYGVVFGSKLGTLKGMKARLGVKEGAVPKCCKPQTVPLAMCKKVNDELDNMVKRAILSPIEWSDWAAPIVPILNSDGSVRICGDFKVTVNPHLNVDS